MVLPLVYALMAAGGYRRYKQDQADQEEHALDMEGKRADRAWTQGERQRTTDMRSAVADAAAPVTPDATPVAPPIGSADVPRAPEDQGIRVGQQTFTDPAAAQTAATAANEPGAVAQRVSGALMRFGDVKSAQDVRTGALQEKKAGIDLDAAQRKVLNEKFDDDLNRRVTTAPEELAQFMSDSRGDGQGGAMKFGVQYSPDQKKWTLTRIGADGKVTATGYSFDNTAAGLERAKAALSRSVSPEGKLTHLHQQAQEEIASRQAATLEKNAETQEQYRKDQAGWMKTMAEARMTAASRVGGAGARADHFDEKQWSAAHKIEPSFVSFPDDLGGKGVESPELRAVYTSEVNAGRKTSTMSPDEAAEAARTTVLKLRNAATDMAAASKGKVTPQQAVRQILEEFNRTRNAPPPAPAPAAAPGGVPGSLPKGPISPPPPPVAAPAPAMASPAELKQRMDAENVEMGAGRRLQYSPEVRAYVDRLRAADESAGEQRRAEEGKKAARRSREQRGT